MLVTQPMIKTLWEKSDIVRSSAIEGRVVSKRFVMDTLHTTMPTLNAFAKSNGLKSVDTPAGDKGYMLEDLAQALGCASSLADLDGRNVDFVEARSVTTVAVEERPKGELTTAFLANAIDFAMANQLTGSFVKLVDMLSTGQSGGPGG